MKKVILAVLIVAIASMGYCAKPTSYITITNLHGNINFNVQDENDEYIPMVINVDGVAKTAEDGRKGVSITKEIGTPSPTKLEGKDLYDALPAWAQPALKDLYLEAIDEDVSQ